MQFKRKRKSYSPHAFMNSKFFDIFRDRAFSNSPNSSSKTKLNDSSIFRNNSNKLLIVYFTTKWQYLIGNNFVSSTAV